MFPDYLWNKKLLTDYWTQLRYHSKQSAAWRTRARFVNLPCGRGSGKTELARRRVVTFLGVKKPWRDPLYFYALPTFNQARKVAWEPLIKLIPKHWLLKVNETQMSIETIFGSKLIVAGTDKPQRLEGVQYDGGVIDEASDQKPGVFDRSILPALAHRNAWCWRIGVPKRYGVGAQEFKASCDRAETNDNVETYAWPSTDILPQEEIDQAKSLLDERDFNEQYMAAWETVGGAIFYSFNEGQNCFYESMYDPNLPLIIGSDFNVDPMSWVICQKKDGCLYIIDELFIRNTNTPETLDRLYKRYPHHIAGWWFFGDATGRARKSSAAQSDYSHIRKDERFTNKRIYYPKKNPMLADRFASCNALFRNAAGDKRCFVFHKCKRLIEDLKARSYKENSREPDDYGDIGHITDALGYVIHSLWPVRSLVSGRKEVGTVSYT